MSDNKFVTIDGSKMVMAAQYFPKAESYIRITRAGFADGRVVLGSASEAVDPHMLALVDGAQQRVNPGDWIVEDASGRLAVLTADEFASKFRPPQRGGDA